MTKTKTLTLDENTTECSIANCDRAIGSHGARGMCQMHYKRFMHTGNPEVRFGSSKHISTHPLYMAHAQMKSRCYSETNREYKYYGARGIKVCDRWLGKDGFQNFLDDMGERPDGMTLDRKDVDKDYSPDNCRWASWHEQQSNRRNNNKVTGVGWHKTNKGWFASLMVKGVKHIKYAGSFDEAVKARLAMEIEYLGAPVKDHGWKPKEE